VDKKPPADTGPSSTGQGTSSPGQSTARDTVETPDAPVDATATDTAAKPELIGFAAMAEADGPTPAPPAPRPSTSRFFLAGGLGGVVGAALMGIGLIVLGPFSDLGERLNALETGLAGAATRRGSEANEKRITALEIRFDALKTEFDGGAHVGGPPDMPSRLGALEQTSAASTRRLDVLEGAISARPSLGREAAQLALATLIRDRLDDGSPFGREIAALEALGLDARVLTPLKAFAAQGTPSAHAFADQFEALAPTLRKAQADSGAEGKAGDWTDRLASALAGVVRITRNNAPLGGGGPTLDHIARALREGYLTEAAQAWGQLDEPVRKAGADWFAGLEARIAAGKAAEELIVMTTAALASAAKPQSAEGTAR
jgi:hypothetical protein